MDIGPHNRDDVIEGQVTTSPGRSGLGPGHSGNNINQSQDHREAAPPAGNVIIEEEGSGMDIEASGRWRIKHKSHRLFPKSTRKVRMPIEASGLNIEAIESL